MLMRRKQSRTRRSRRITAAVGLMVILLFVGVADNVFARGGFRGGGFRSSSSFRTFGASRSTRRSGGLFGWGSSTRRSTAAAPSRSGGAVAGSRSSVAAQRNLYSTAKRNGTLYSSRTDAVQAFRSKYSNQYTSRFASQPASRPSYIPRSTVVDGRTVNVVYNSGLGGYGYMDPVLGRWVMYNALADAAMVGVLMSNHGYYWGAPPVYVSHGPGFFTWAIILFLAFMVLSSLTRARRGARRR